MGAHIVFFGPSTAGKTSLMLSLAETSAEYSFSVDKTWTTRSRRPDECDKENVFVDQEEFDEKRSDFLFTFQTYPTYEYGIEVPRPLAEREIRMRILMPVFAVKLRGLIAPPVAFCAVSPLDQNPENAFTARDPNVDPGDMHSRLRRFHSDRKEADEAADLVFQNTEGIDKAVAALGTAIIDFLVEKQHLPDPTGQVLF